MPFAHLPALLSSWFSLLVTALDRRSAPRLALLFCGALFARGRRTVTSWFRAAGIADAFRPAYSALWAAGRHARDLGFRLLRGVLRPLLERQPGGRLLFAIDDTPTPRYGPCVQGAGIHHNPAPGPAGEKYVYGHLWVTLAWLARHPLWHTLALPLSALLYVRQKDVPELARDYPWAFRTKLELAVELVRDLVWWVGRTGQALWLAVDGAYAKRPFLRPVLELGLVVVSRLRRDADLHEVPAAARRPGQRGPLPTYGKQKIDLAKRAGQKRGWQRVRCVPYGEEVAKEVKTFVATWRPAGGRIRVVLVRETDGWLPYFGTDPEATAAEVLEAKESKQCLKLEVQFRLSQFLDGLSALGSTGRWLPAHSREKTVAIRRSCRPSRDVAPAASSVVRPTEGVRAWNWTGSTTATSTCSSRSGCSVRGAGLTRATTSGRVRPRTTG